MELNPYSSPSEAPEPLSGEYSIDFRVFKGKFFSFALLTGNQRNEVRQVAREAIESEIGADNVVTIAEHDTTGEGFSVVVWFRVSKS